MLARRRPNLRKNKKPKSGLLKYLLTGIVIIVLSLTSFVDGRVFKANQKLIVVVPSDEAVEIGVFDPVNDEITSLIIPNNVEVDVSRNLGKWRIGSVWRLGQNERIGGKLLAETIVKNFCAPVTAWLSPKGTSFIRGDIKEIISSVFLPGGTNLNFIDRVKLAIFSVRIKNFKRSTLDLSTTGFLEKTKLRDGGDGYLVTKNIPNKLLILFADEELVKSAARVSITNSTSDRYFIKDLGKIIEVMGAKVVFVNQEKEANFDCVISSKSKIQVAVLVSVFGCKYIKESGSSAEIEFRVGADFLNRF